MSRTQKWLLGVALIGAAAGVAATGLLWLLLTRPVTLAVMFESGF